MRTLSPLVMLLVAGCGGNGNASGDLAAPADMAVASAADLAPPVYATCMPPDLAGGLPPITDMASPLNCLGYGGCIQGCLAQGSGDLNTCQTMCTPKAKPGSVSKWTAAIQCGQDYCEKSGASDMAGAKCVLVADPQNPSNHLLCDPGQTYAECMAATTPGVCVTCLDNARNILLLDKSADPNNPGPPRGICPCGPNYVDCKGGAMCATVMDACLNDP